MAIKQYVGARYVPKFATPTEWQADTAYEGLTIVTYNGSSYTSKKSVPTTVGIPSRNEEYWALTGNYNSQVEEYRQTTLQYKEETDKIKNELKITLESFGAVGDGTTDSTDAINNAIAYCTTNKLPLTSKGGTYLFRGDLNITCDLDGCGTLKASTNSSATINPPVSINNTNFDKFDITVNGYGCTLTNSIITHFRDCGIKIVSGAVSNENYKLTQYSNILLNDYDTYANYGIYNELPDQNFDKIEVINAIHAFYTSANCRFNQCAAWFNNNAKNATNFDENSFMQVKDTGVELVNCTSDTYKIGIQPLFDNLAIQLTNFSFIVNTVIMKNTNFKPFTGDGKYVRGYIYVNMNNFNKVGNTLTIQPNKAFWTIVNGTPTNPLVYTPTPSSGQNYGNNVVNANGDSINVNMGSYHPITSENLTFKADFIPTTYDLATRLDADGRATLVPIKIKNGTATVEASSLTTNCCILYSRVISK